MMTPMCVDTSTRAVADLDFRCRLAHDACATRSLAFGTGTVAAADMQAAFMAALNGPFADVASAREICATL
jgi:nicotinamidase-related amidase